MLARFAEEIHAAGHLYKLGHPIAAGHQRIDPLDVGNRGICLEPVGALYDVIHSTFELIDEMFRAVRSAQRVANSTYIDPHIVQRIRLQ